LSLVEFTQARQVGFITLNRPEKKNALNTAMSLELEAAVDRIENSDDIRVGVLRAVTGGSRPVFSAGYDLTGGIGDEHGGFTERGGFGGLTSRERSKPLIAAVNGLAIAGGFELVLACDLIVASRDASFALAEVKWNLVAAAGGVFRLTRIIGRIAAMDLILTGQTVPAERAYELGLVSRLAEVGRVDEVALELAETIATNAPVAVRLNRDAVLKSEYYDDREAWELCDKLVIAVNESADSAEGVRAFLERRPPVWTGR
jgi:enoyl-CoA hydratase